MKLQLPMLPLNFIRRNHVMAKIEQHAQCGLHVFSAASGYGKSLSLAQWLHQKKQQKELVCWLTLDANENDPLRFVTYLICAFNSADSQLAKQSLLALERNASLDEIVTILHQELCAYSGVLHVALDDIHHLTQVESLEILQQFFDYSPACIHFYCTTSKPFPLSISRYIGQDKCVQYDEHDLMLTREETQTWIENTIKTPLESSKIDEIFNQSHGWFTGLVLIKKCLENSGHSCIDGSEKVLTDYFDQYWRPLLSEEEFKLCMNLTKIGKASGLYYDAVFGETESGNTLNQLVKKHVLVISDQANNDWFYPHPLLNLFLSKKIDSLTLADELALAGSWLNQHGFHVQAVEMALKANNTKQAALLLETTAEDIFEKQDIALLLSWKKQLPGEVIASSPRLVVIFSWTLAFAQQLDDAERLLAKMDHLLVSDKSIISDGLSGQLFAIRGYIARCRGKMDNAIQLGKQALEKLDDTHYVAKSITYYNLSNVYMSLSKLSEARQYNRLSFSTARAVGSIHLEMLAIHEQARIEQVKGNLHLAEKILNEGIVLSEQLTDRDTVAAYGRLLTYKGYIVWLKNRVDEAEQLLLAGISIAERCHDAYIIMGHVLLNNIERNRGNIEKAYDYLSKVEAILQYWSVPGFIYQPWLATMRVNLLIDENKIDTALVNIKFLYAQLAQNDYALSPEHYPGLRRLVDVFYVRAKSISGQHAVALKQLDKRLESHNDTQEGFSLIFSFLMRALLRYQLGQEDNALQDFRRAIFMAEKNFCIMPFIEYSQSMVSLYDSLPNSVKQKEFVQTILSNIQLNDEGNHNQSFAKVRNIISQREMAVLKLIAEGLSNQEIAERLFISLHTVKTHARRINSKLSVKSRTQAILRAREIGVI